MPPRGRPSSSHSSSRSRSSSSRSSSHRSSSSSYRSHSSYHSRPHHSSHSSYSSSRRYNEPRSVTSAHSSWTDNRYSDNYRDYDYYSDGFEERRANRSSGKMMSILFVILIMVMTFVLGKAVTSKDYSNKEINKQIYVSELGRNVSWSNEYDSYYDPQTDCYFFLNTDVEPEVWQYWFEGISSDYGNYGWMEYDYEEKRWYIQIGMNSWSILPSKYNNNPNLWHFKE